MERKTQLIVIPIQIQDDVHDLSGLINFTTEKQGMKSTSLKSNLQFNRDSVLYKNQIGKVEDEEEDVIQRRMIQSWSVSIKSRKINKKFKVNVPVIKGHKSANNNNRGGQQHFYLNFDGNKGKLVCLGGMQDAVCEIITKQKAPNINQQVEIQKIKYDGRKKEQKIPDYQKL